MALTNYFKAFVNLLFPGICDACGNTLAGNESRVCTSCLANLPFTHYWKSADNPVSALFWGRISIENAASMLFFEKGSTLQHLLHNLKYKGKNEIGIVLGKISGVKLQGTPYANADLIIPIPLHASRQRKRGYNQSEMIAKGLSASLNIPLESKAIIRCKPTRSQTAKTRYERWQNVEGAFLLTRPEALTGKHLLVIDDVVTTGATSEACMEELLRAKGTTVSYLAIASA